MDDDYDSSGNSSESGSEYTRDGTPVYHSLSDTDVVLSHTRARFASRVPSYPLEISSSSVARMARQSAARTATVYKRSDKRRKLPARVCSSVGDNIRYGLAYSNMPREPLFFLVLDVETSGPIVYVHQVIAVGMCVLSVHWDSKKWVVAVVRRSLFTYPQENMVFADGIRDPDQFWGRNAAQLERMREHALAHGMTPAEVTTSLAQELDYINENFNYPNIISDNPEYDVGQVNLLFGIHIGRTPMSHVRIDDDDMWFARRATSTQSMATMLVPARFTHYDDLDGTPSMLNMAIRWLKMEPLPHVSITHNPLDDVKMIALNTGRIYCRYWELRIESAVAYPIACYAYGSKEHMRYSAYSGDAGNTKVMVRKTHKVRETKALLQPPQVLKHHQMPTPRPIKISAPPVPQPSPQGSLGGSP
jgi:hypothetical protein